MKWLRFQSYMQSYRTRAGWDRSMVEGHVVVTNELQEVLTEGATVSLYGRLQKKKQ